MHYMTAIVDIFSIATSGYGLVGWDALIYGINLTERVDKDFQTG